MNKVTIVLAGNIEQYERYVIEAMAVFPDKRFIYGSTAYKIYGARATEIVVTGTFWERTNATRLYDLANERVMK